MEAGNSGKIVIVSATRCSEEEFWDGSALGISIKQKIKDDPRLSADISFRNTRGLPEVYNDAVRKADLGDILVFVHDDVWMDESDPGSTILEGLLHFDVLGVAGNRRWLPGQPAWAFIDDKFTWDDRENLSGAVGHGETACGPISEFGAVPAECELLDGVLLVVRKKTLVDNDLMFDPQFDFHFYDMDFCRSARERGLRLGTWNLRITHQSGGAFGSPSWREKHGLYMQKWEAVTDSVKNDVMNDLEVAITPIFKKAVAHQYSQDLGTAAQLYAIILGVDPRNPAANHNLGVIEVKEKGAMEALPRFEMAVTEDPSCEEFWVSYIDALMKCGAKDTALSALQWGTKFGLRKETAVLLEECYGEKALFEVKSLVCDNASRVSVC